MSQEPIEFRKVRKFMNKLVGYRGTQAEIIKLLIDNSYNKQDVSLEPFEEPLPDNDFGFNTNLGEFEDMYLDFEIYMLPTNTPYEWIITEVNPF